jgi:hypothetical protein
MVSTATPTAVSGIGGTNINPTGGSLLSSLLGGSGAYGQAANQVWQNGQFMPYNLSLPGSTLNFNGNSATGSLSAPQQGIQNSYLSQLQNAIGGATYSPNAGLSGALSQFQNNLGTNPNLTQYGNVNTAGNSLVGASQGLLSSVPNFNQSLQSNYQSLANSQLPFLQQASQSNLDSEFAKGTLASTAGSYQTAGQQLANASVLNQDYSTAFNQAQTQQNSAYQNAASLGSSGSNINLQQGGLLGNLASTQFGQNLSANQALFGAAGTAANLGEQQSEFGAQYNQNQANSAFTNINTQNQAVQNSLATGGGLGAQQSAANTAASQGFLGAGQASAQGQSGLLNSLLFGNGGTNGSGLLGSLLGGQYGTSGAGGLLGSLGSGLSSLLGSGAGGSGITNQYANGTSNYSQGLNSGLSDQFGNQASNYSPDLSNLGDYNSGGIDWGDGSFPSAGGQAALGQSTSNQQSQNNSAFDAYSATNNGLSGNYDNPELQRVGDDATVGVGSINNPYGTAPSSTGSLAGAVGALNLATGLQQGGIGGGLKAASGANSLLNSAGVSTGSAGQGLGQAGNALGIYSGIQKGGISGYGSAAVNAAQLAGSLTGNTALSAGAGYLAAPLAIYNFANNWQSGATGSDAMNGAAAGAAVGSIVPGIGTAIGAVIGGAVGALSSAFGPGKTDPETTGVKNVINATSANGNSTAVSASVQNPYMSLAGLFDEKSSTLPIYSQYGRMGEQKFTTDMTTKINQAVQANPSLKNNPQAVYSQVIQPWVQGMGNWNNVGSTYQATTFGTIQDMVGQYMSGNAASNWKAVGGDSPFSNIYNGSPYSNANPAPTPVSSGAGKQAVGNK